MHDLYVDGKAGSDANTGTQAAPFKTIARAMAALPQGSSGQAAGWIVRVQGYADYVYRERAIPAGVVCSGTSTAPLLIQATDYGNAALSSGGTPWPATVDGSVLVNTDSAPEVSWSNVQGAVWQTPWPNALSLGTAVLDYTDTQRKERLWCNTSISARRSLPLRRPVPAAGAGAPLTLDDLDGAGYSYFLDRWSAQGAGICSTAPGSVALPTLGTLYVNLTPPAGITNPAYVVPASTDPHNNTLEMPVQSTFYMDTGWSYVTLRGIRAWHGDLGFHIDRGCHHIALVRCDGSFNYCMGFATFGTSDLPTHDIALRRCSATGNSIQGVKLEGASSRIQVAACDFLQNCLQDGLDLVGDAVHDVLIAGTTIHDGNLVPAYNRYYDDPAGKIVGILLEDACYNITVSGCTLDNAANGIATYSSGIPTLSHGAGSADPRHGGDFGLVATGNVVKRQVHVGADSGFGISCGYPDLADEAGCAISWSGNTVSDCDGGGTGLNAGSFFAYTPTGKTFA
jgi:parallel beta-helix repeat protein